MNDVVRTFILMTIVYRFFSNDSSPYTLIMTSIILPLYFSKLGAIVGAKLNQTGFNVSTLCVQGKKIPFDAHCSLKKGDIAQVCGPSGCGKSTLHDNLFLNTAPTKEMETRFLHEPLLQSIFATKSFESKILEGGANLSGGEKQKIAFARELFSSADVLILDAVCSDIDREAANAIYECLQRERNQRITILISHEQVPEGLVNVKINQSSQQPKPI